MKLLETPEKQSKQVDNYLDTYMLGKNHIVTPVTKSCGRCSLSKALPRWRKNGHKHLSNDKISDLIKNETCAICLVEYGKSINIL